MGAPRSGFDWTKTVSSNGKLNIKVTTWNTFMLPIVGLDQINGKSVLPQEKKARRTTRFIQENEDFRTSDILLLQEVWSPGKNIFSNLIEGFWRLAGHPSYGRNTLVRGLREAGFHYITGAPTPFIQTLRGFYDSGLIIASKIPFDL